MAKSDYSTIIVKESDLANPIPEVKKKGGFSIKSVLGLLVFTLMFGFGLGFLTKFLSPQHSVKADIEPIGLSKIEFQNLEKYEYCSAGAKVDSVTRSGTSKNITGIFKESDVRKHVEYQLNTEGFQYAPNLKTSFKCVDSRADFPIFGTPGGDLAEFAIGLTTYYKSIGQEPDYASIQSKFKRFLKEVASKDRPFYFHTDDTRLKMVFKNMTEILGRNITVLPDTYPPENEKKFWLRELSESYAQGCGHIRLMIASPKKYGLTNSLIIKTLIKVFYEEWWSRSIEDKKVLDFSIKLGSLAGKAIGIVSNSGNSCSDASPLITPNSGGSSIFVYHATPASQFREKILAPFFSKGTMLSSFYKSMEDLFTTQLTATLTDLSPANAVDLFAISVKN
jgi:hypothetical protein